MSTISATAANAAWDLWSVGGTATASGTTVTLQGGASDVQNWTKADGTNPAGMFVKSFLSTSDYNGQTVESLLGLLNWTSISGTQPYINLFVTKNVGGVDYHCILASFNQDGVKDLNAITWKTYEPGQYVNGSWVFNTTAFGNGATATWDTVKGLTLQANGWLNWAPTSSYPTARQFDAVRIGYGDSAGNTNYPGSGVFEFSGQINAVPEPSSILALASGLLSIGGLALRRRK